MTTRVLQIIPTLVRGGAEKQLCLLAAGLPKDRYDVHVCCLTYGGPREAELQAAEIPCHIIGKRWKLDLSSYYRLRRHIRSLAPDIVHTWLFAANAYGRQAALSVGAPHVIAAERCVDPWKSSWQLAIDRRLAERTERIVANSSGVREFYVAQGLPAEKFAIIPNGAPAADEGPAAPRDEVLASLDLPPDARLIGAVGRLWPQKRVKDLIWAADLLWRVRDDAHLLVIGDGPLRWRLERYARQVEVDERVHFLGERSDVARLMPHFDCLLLASSYEGQSNAILEAMANAVPVVATDIAGNRDLVVPDQTGYLVPVGDRAAFARWTNVLLDDPALARRLGEAGRRRVLEEFSVGRMVERHDALYQELLA